MLKTDKNGKKRWNLKVPENWALDMDRYFKDKGWSRTVGIMRACDLLRKEEPL